MVSVQTVIVGAQGCCEPRACAVPNGPQKYAFFRAVVPIPDQPDTSPVGKIKPRDVDRISRSMGTLAVCRTLRGAYGTAIVAANLPDRTYLSSKDVLCGRLQAMILPQRQTQRCRAGCFDGFKLCFAN